MTIDEICSLLVSMSVLNLHHTTLHKDCLLLIEKNLDKLDNQQLVQMISIAKYISKFKNHNGNINLTKDFYHFIHEKCVFSKQTFNDAQIRLINRVLKNDGIITKSPFL
jgi:hypothetical protein